MLFCGFLGFSLFCALHSFLLDISTTLLQTFLLEIAFPGTLHRAHSYFSFCSGGAWRLSICKSCFLSWKAATSQYPPASNIFGMPSTTHFQKTSKVWGNPTCTEGKQHFVGFFFFFPTWLTEYFNLGGNFYAGILIWSVVRQQCASTVCWSWPKRHLYCHQMVSP